MNKKQLEIIDQHRKLLDSLRATTNNNIAHQCYGCAATEFNRFVNELDAADSKCHHGKASTEESERIVAIHKSLADLWSDFRKSEAGRRSLASDQLSSLADVKDECEKLRTNERQITEYVNKIRVDLDKSIRFTSVTDSNLRDTISAMKDRLARLEEYCHTHYVDATGACCPGELVVGVKPVKAEEAAAPVQVPVDDGDGHIDAGWLVSACGFTPRSGSPVFSERCYYESPKSTNGNFFNIWLTDPVTLEWVTSYIKYPCPQNLRNPLTRRDVRERAAYEGVVLAPTSATTSP